VLSRALLKITPHYVWECVKSFSCTVKILNYGFDKFLIKQQNFFGEFDNLIIVAITICN
jgi:hypothetical protein